MTTCSAGAGRLTVLNAFRPPPCIRSSAPDLVVPSATATTPVGVSATDRAAWLTETLPVSLPLAESNLNRPMLEFPATAHMVPSASGPVADSSERGAAMIRSGRTLRACWHRFQLSSAAGSEPESRCQQCGGYCRSQYDRLSRPAGDCCGASVLAW